MQLNYAPSTESVYSLLLYVDFWDWYLIQPIARELDTFRYNLPQSQNTKSASGQREVETRLPEEKECTDGVIHAAESESWLCSDGSRNVDRCQQ